MERKTLPYFFGLLVLAILASCTIEGEYSYDTKLESSTTKLSDVTVSTENPGSKFTGHSGSSLNYLTTGFNGTDTSYVFIKFDIDSIVSKEDYIESAFLTLKDTTVTGFTSSEFTSADSLRIVAAASSWDEESINWANKPNYNLVNSVTFSVTDTIKSGEYRIDVTGFIQYLAEKEIDGFAILRKRERPKTLPSGQLVHQKEMIKTFISGEVKGKGPQLEIKHLKF